MYHSPTQPGQRQGGLPVWLLLSLWLPLLSAEPQLSFDGRAFDGGKTPVDSAVQHNFSFINSGTTELVIEKVWTSCGCTVAELPKKRFGPSEGGKLPVTLKVGNVGPINKNVFVRSNDPAEPEMTLSITAEGTRHFVIDKPPPLNNLKLGEQRRFVLNIASSNDLPFALAVNEVADMSAGTLTAKVEADDGTKRSATWQLSLVVDVKTYHHSVTPVITLESDHPEQQEIVLKVPMSIRYPLQIAGDDRQFLGVLAPGHSRSREWRMFFDDRRSFQIDEAAFAQAKHFVVAVTANAEKTEHRIAVTATAPDLPDGYLSDRLTLRTNAFTITPAFSFHVIHDVNP